MVLRKTQQSIGAQWGLKQITGTGQIGPTQHFYAKVSVLSQKVSFSKLFEAVIEALMNQIRPNLIFCHE